MPEQVVLEDYFGGVVTQVGPATVVSVDERGRLLWRPVGSPVRRPEKTCPIRDIPRDEWPQGGFPLVEDEWFGNDVLIFQATGANHSVWWLFAQAANSEPGTSTSRLVPPTV